MPSDDAPSRDLDRLYPLLRRFATSVLPLLAAGAIGLLFSVNAAVITGIEQFHAARETTGLEPYLRRLPIEALRERAASDTSPSAADFQFAGELSRRGLSCLSLHDTTGRPVFEVATVPGCHSPAPQAFAEVAEDGNPILAEELVRPGDWTALASIALPQRPDAAFLAASRPAAGLETTAAILTGWRTVLFAAAFLGALVTIIRRVARAQRALDRTHEALLETRHRMKRYLSKGAQANAFAGQTEAERIDAVILFADLRNFSGFAETASVEAVRDLVDRFVGAAADAIEAQDGDVDKIMGDGVLARFEGDDASQRVLLAAVDLVRGCEGLERRPGVGLFAGEVIATPVGGGDRADFTVLGRTVNLASRLCSMAGEDEVVAPASLAVSKSRDLAVRESFETRPKNHAEPLHVVRYAVKPLRHDLTEAYGAEQIAAIGTP